MEIKDLIKPAEKTLDITVQMGKKFNLFGKKEFVTLRRFPSKMKYTIESAKLKGFNMGKVTEEIRNRNLEYNSENIALVMSTTPGVITEEFDNMHEHKMLAVGYGIDPNKHSFTKEGKTIAMDGEFWENLQDSNPVLFEFIYNAVMDYQKELELGETIGKP